MQIHICTQYENFETELCKHLRACALKPFSLHFFNPSFGLTNLDGRLLGCQWTLSQFSHLAIWPGGSTVEGFVSTLHCETAFWPRKLGRGRAS